MVYQGVKSLVLMILIFGFFTAQAAEKTVVTQSTEEYLLLPEDVLSISVWKEEGLQQQVVIQPDGGLSFPLVISRIMSERI